MKKPAKKKPAKLTKKILKWLARCFGVIVGLFLLLAVLIYLPPVQQWIKNYVCDYLSEETGMKVEIEKVRLAFPLDLWIYHMSATEKNDTIVAAQGLLLDVKVWPLLSGKVGLNGFELRKAQINSKSYISDTRIEGSFGLLAIDKPAVGDLSNERVDINKVRLRDTDVRIILSDTAKVDTTESGEPTLWIFALNKVDVKNTRFYLQMPGDSMRLGGDVKNLQLSEALIDLGKESYALKSLSLAARDVSYDIPYEPTTDGFDTNHLLLEALNAKMSDVAYNSQGLDLDLKHLSLKEKSGLQVNEMTADVHYDSTRVDVTDGHIETPYSTLDATVGLPFAALDGMGPSQLEAKLKGTIGKQDVMLLAGEAMGDMAAQYPDTPLTINMRAEGTLSDLDIDYCHLTLPNSMAVRVSGRAHQLMSDTQRNGQLHYTVELSDASVVNAFIPDDLKETIHIPSGLQLGGDISFRGNSVDLSRNALYCNGGRLTVNGHLSTSTMTYKADVDADQFPLQLFLPDMGMSPLTAAFDVHGHGTDFHTSGTSIIATAKIDSFAYAGIPFDNMMVNANVSGPEATGSLQSDNEWLKGLLDFKVEQEGAEMRCSLHGTVDDFALNMGQPADTIDGNVIDTHLMMDIDIKGWYNPETESMAVGGVIDPLNAYTPTNGYPGGNIRFGLGTSPDSTDVYFNSGDMVATLKSTDHLQVIIDRFSNYATQFVSQFETADLNQDSLKTLLPNTHLSIHAAKVSPIRQVLSMQGYDLDTIYADITTSPERGINGSVCVENFSTGTVLFETSRLDLAQDSSGLKLSAAVENSKRKNPNKFSARVDGELHSNGFSVLAHLADADGRTGLNVGTRASLDGLGGMSFGLIPEVSTIAYREFTVNQDNYIALDSDGMLSADIDLVADDKTGIKFYTIPDDTTKQDITLSVTHLNLRDQPKVVPYLPQMTGLLDGDIHVIKEQDALTAVGAIQATNLSYEGTPIGTLGTELFYMPEEGGHYVLAQILKDDDEVAVLDGHYYNQDEGTLDALLTLDQLPCAMINPMLGDDGTLALSGLVNGEVNIKGPTDKIALDGLLSPDSIHVYSELYGFDLRMEDKDISINSNKIELDDISFYSRGENPLVIDGDIDLGNFDDMLIDLTIQAQDYELVSSEKTKKSMIYGNAFVDIDATLQGHGDFMALRGKVNVLKKTNITYVMTDTPLQVEDQFSGLVEFVDFSEVDDQEEEETTPPGGTLIGMAISIDENARLHCDLSDDGKSYLDCKGGGDLTLLIFPSGDMSVNGRFNINSGEMKYTLPFIPLKTFTFTEGNYVQFNGEVSNPTLNITALESVKASVTDDTGTSRMVNFKVGVSITRPINDMEIDFVIEAPDDEEVQSEIASMTAETKSKTAITLLATGMYLSTNNKSTYNTNNALNAFLESEIQRLAGSTLKSIDISVGVEGNTTTTGETQTDYTFQFSKKLWNDRVSMIIGGKLTTGATDETSATQSFIDIAPFEYRLDQNNTRYIRVFYDNDTYEPLEGHYSSAGAGFVMRRKTNNLGELLILKKKDK